MDEYIRMELARLAIVHRQTTELLEILDRQGQANSPKYKGLQQAAQDLQETMQRLREEKDHEKE